MLSLFPSLLSYAFFTPLILRIVAGLFFVYIAYRITTTRAQIAHTKLPVIGHPAPWLIWLMSIIVFITGMLLVIGMWTQAAAILGMLIALKHGLGTRNYSAIVPLSASAYTLLFFICFSLLLSGAGAIAVDLPL